MATAVIHGSDQGDFQQLNLIWSALNALGVAKYSPYDVVDLSGLRHIRPYTATAVAALGCLSGRQARLVLPQTQQSRDYATRTGLLEFFDDDNEARLSRSPRAVGVTQLDKPSATFADDITRLWEKEFGGMPAGLRPRFADHLDEVVRNALSHAMSPIGCLVAAQVYPSTRLVEVAVLDLGQTILKHLTGNPTHAKISTDEDAILAATTEGITGTRDGEVNALGEPNSGVGLYELRRYCEAGGGTASIVSGYAIVTFSSEGPPDSKKFQGGFPGCLVNFQFTV